MPVVAFLVLLSTAQARAVLLDSQFTETMLVNSQDLVGATAMAWAPDGSNRLFVTHQNGAIFIIKDGVLLPTPFATVSPLYVVSECGLLGIAFDPNFAVNNAVYVFATVSATEQQVIRYTSDGDIGIDKTTIVAGLPTRGVNHDGGGLGIGPDGKLYWSIGDNGAGVGANEDLMTMASKVGRANLDGSPVADNPFVDGAGPNADYIFARGFRNPFTLNFQPATGLLWVDVVGAIYEQVFIVHKGDHGGWNSYENNQPTGFITPTIVYRTNTVDTRTILPTGASRVGGRVRFSTDVPHLFRLGAKINVAGVADATFNGGFYVAGIPSDTSFEVVQAGPDAVSGGGTAATAALGGAVTGGAFYDATAFPAAYRGNYFFGDYNSGYVVRATIDATTNAVTSVDPWATGVVGGVDTTVGPDGALYYMGTSSIGVFRTSYNATIQGLVVSPTNVWIAEGQPAIVMVSLAMQPASNVAVAVVRSGGDADIAVTSGAALTFTAANWNRPQAVRVAAGRDLDSSDDTATFSVSASDVDAQSFIVHARDENGVGLVVAPVALAIDEGGSGTFTVALSAQPSLDVSVNAARSAGDVDVTVTAGSTLTFTRSNWSVPQIVTVAAAKDADGTDDTATIAVSSSGIPAQTVMVTAHDNTTAPAITSSPILTGRVGSAYRYDVEATGAPVPTFALDSTVAGMAIDGSTGTITWTPGTPGSFAVTVRARNGTPPDAVQTFTVEVAPAAVDVDAGVMDATMDVAMDSGGDAVMEMASVQDASASDDQTAGDAPAGDAATGTKPSDSGCGCHIDADQPSGAPAIFLILALILVPVLTTRAKARRRR